MAPQASQTNPSPAAPCRASCSCALAPTSALRLISRSFRIKLTSTRIRRRRTGPFIKNIQDALRHLAQLLAQHPHCSSFCTASIRHVYKPRKAKAGITFRGASASRQTACRGFAARGGCPPAKVHDFVRDQSTKNGAAVHSKF